MKKIFTAVLTVLLLLCLPLFAHASQEPYRYTDVSGGVQLTVPQGWDLEYEETGTAKVRFVPQGVVSAGMQYGSLSHPEPLSPAAVAELTGCQPAEVRRITMDGREYYRAVFSHTVPLGQFCTTLPVTCWAHWENGVVSLYQYVGSDADPLYNLFKAMIAGAVYTQAEGVTAETGPVETVPAETRTAETVPSETKTAETVPSETQIPETTPTEIQPVETVPGATENTLYPQAVQAYEAGDYAQAQTLFSAVSELEDSGKYLRLLRIRNAGSNVSLGTGTYQKELGLTEEQKQDIDEAARDFSFADTAQVLLCSSDVASYYLTGHWSGGINSSYLYFKPGDSGVTCRIGTNLSPKNYPDFGIQNGELHGYEAGEDILLLKLRLTQTNTLEVTACQQDGQLFTLIRK